MDGSFAFLVCSHLRHLELLQYGPSWVRRRLPVPALEGYGEFRSIGFTLWGRRTDDVPELLEDDADEKGCTRRHCMTRGPAASRRPTASLALLRTPWGSRTPSARQLEAKAVPSPATEDGAFAVTLAPETIRRLSAPFWGRRRYGSGTYAQAPASATPERVPRYLLPIWHHPSS